MKISCGLGGTGLLAMPWWLRTWYVRFAKFLGIRYFDTAQYYGGSEKILGRSGLENLTVVTKWGMGHAPSDSERWGRLFPAESCVDAVTRSKEVIGVTKHFGFLLHLPCEDHVQTHIESLRRAKKTEEIRYIGYSADTQNHILHDNSWCDWIVIHHSLASELKGFSGVVAVHGVFKSELSAHDFSDIMESLSAATELIFLIGTSKPWRLVSSLRTVRRLAKA